MRAHDWPEKFVSYLNQRERAVFTWGKHAHDCASFGAGWVRIALGVEPLDGLPDYSTAEEAEAILESASFAAMIDERLPRIDIGLAKRGDIGLIETERGDAVVIIDGVDLVGPAKRRGLVRYPRFKLVAAWEV